MPLEYIVRAEMWPVNTQLHCSYYKWQLHLTATKELSSGCLCGKYQRKSYNCNIQIVKNE
jgi:hypothetical protein